MEPRRGSLKGGLLIRVGRELCQEVRPIPPDNPAHLITDGLDVIELLDLPAEAIKVFGTQRAAVQKFHWEPRRKIGFCSPDRTGNK